MPQLIPVQKILIFIKTTTRCLSQSAHLSMDDPNERSQSEDWSNQATDGDGSRIASTTSTVSTTSSEERRRLGWAVATWEAGNCDDRSSTNPTSHSDVKASVKLSDSDSDNESDTAKDEYHPERKSISDGKMTFAEISQEIHKDHLQSVIYKAENEYIDNNLREIGQKLHSQKTLGKQVLSEEEHLKLSDFIAKHEQYFEGKIDQRSFEDGLNNLYNLNKARQVVLEKHESKNIERMVSTLEKDLNSNATNADNSDAAKTDTSNTDLAHSKAESNTSQSKPSVLDEYADLSTEPFDPFDPDA